MILAGYAGHAGHARPLVVAGAGLLPLHLGGHQGDGGRKQVNILVFSQKTHSSLRGLKVAINKSK